MRSLNFAVAAAFFVAFFVSCGPTQPLCSPTTCTGCCNPDGICEQGFTQTACGLGGTACRSCGLSEQCGAGACTISLSGLGGGNATGGGHGTGGGGNATGGGGGHATGGGSATGGGGGSLPFSGPCAGLDSIEDLMLVPFGVNSSNDLCTQVNVSRVSDRGHLRERYAQCLETQAAVSPGSGNFRVNRNSSGRVSSVSFSPSGAGESTTESFNYTVAGKLSSWSKTFSGTTQNIHESFNYTAAGRISSWSRTFSGATQSVYESFNYTASGRPSSWSRTYSGDTESTYYNYSYSSAGRISSWSRTHSGANESQYENFSYNASGRVSNWSRTYSGSTPSQNASISYSSTGNVSNLSTNGTGLAGFAVAPCP